MEPILRRINNTLAQLELDHRVSILYAVESGSRAWGFESRDSDYDVRFIYARAALDYLRIRPARDVIELPIAGDLDVNGWDIVKALNLFRSSNPTLLEWLRSPIVYREQGAFAESLRALTMESVSKRRMGYHYLSMAGGQFRDYIDGRSEVSSKKYLYALRPLLCLNWITQYGTPPPTAVKEMIPALSLPAAVLDRLNELIARKMSGGEVGLGPADEVLTGYCRIEIARFDQLVPGLPDPPMESEPLDQLFQQVLGVSGIL
jgi:hypothetical protein